MHFGSGEAETACLLGYLEAAALPLHDIVVADDAFVHEAADAVEIFRSGAPCRLAIARRPGEAAVVVGDEFAQHGVGGVEVLGLGEPQFAGEAILQHTPEPLDAAFGLRAVGSHEGDAELLQGAAELRGLAFTGELFFDGPVVVVADEDAAVVAIQSEWHTVPADHLLKQAEIAESGFREKELRRQDFAGGVVLHEFSELGGTQSALTMRGSAALSRGAEAVLAQQAAKGLATEGKALVFHEFLAQMVVVEAG